MQWLFVMLLVGLLPGCAPFAVHKQRNALDAAVSTAINDDEFCQNSGAKPGTPSYLDAAKNFLASEALGHPQLGDE
jgi:hypothetical protein